MAEKAAKIPDDIAALSFEEALAALEEIVAKLESGEVGLEDSIAIYTRGSLLRQHCQDKLKSAEAKIEKIQIGEPGEPPQTVPFDADEG
jgi:exodeoxyribonuclease VII small subunit